MLAIVVGQSGYHTVASAFMEEATRCIVISAHADFNANTALLKKERVDEVVAADAGAVKVAEDLQEKLYIRRSGVGDSTKRTDRLAQQDAIRSALGVGLQAAGVKSHSDIDAIFGKGVHAISLVPKSIGASDTVYYCKDRKAAYLAFDNIANNGSSSELAVLAVLSVQEKPDPLSRYSIETVSLNGEHLVGAVFKHRMDVINNQEVRRHIIGVAIEEPLFEEISAFARRCLDAAGVRAGSAIVEAQLSKSKYRLIQLSCAPDHRAPADAAFVAHGISHQHLLTESILRPHEFRRRLERPVVCESLVLARAFVSLPRRREENRLDGLRFLRRLAGFHSLAEIPDAAGRVTELQVSFVHEDGERVENSLGVLHELVDSGGLFEMDREAIGYPPDAIRFANELPGNAASII